MFLILYSIRHQELQEIFSKYKLHNIEETTFPTTFISQQKSTK
jgi:hypothetical protein